MIFASTDFAFEVHLRNTGMPDTSGDYSATLALKSPARRQRVPKSRSPRFGVQWRCQPHQYDETGAWIGHAGSFRD